MVGKNIQTRSTQEENKRNKPKKEERRKKIRDIITQKNISSQDELLEILKKEGIFISQPTLSREMKALDIVKHENRLVLSGEANTNLYRQGLKTALQKYTCSSAVVVEPLALRTAPGHARSVAVMIEQSFQEEVFGTIAGEDTILVMVKKDKAGVFSEVFEKLLGKNGSLGQS